ncbi:hypothetical protein ACFQZI_10865 [Mucilaginibacter lutimaris]|uniref:Uncharacterized protein n=1 Tax=Mucilaginibacter lutimaris TaxID=931629 RepID=A0ABW2ZGY5_9SPHI
MKKQPWFYGNLYPVYILIPVLAYTYFKIRDDYSIPYIKIIQVIIAFINLGLVVFMQVVHYKRKQFERGLKK